MGDDVAEEVPSPTAFKVVGELLYDIVEPRLRQLGPSLALVDPQYVAWRGDTAWSTVVVRTADNPVADRYRCDAAARWLSAQSPDEVVTMETAIAPRVDGGTLREDVVIRLRYAQREYGPGTMVADVPIERGVWPEQGGPLRLAWLRDSEPGSLAQQIVNPPPLAWELVTLEDLTKLNVAAYTATREET